MNKKYLIQSLKVIFLGVILAAGISFAQTWTGPGCAAPGCNAPAPINVSTVDQVKAGSLTLGTTGDFLTVNGLATIFGDSHLLGNTTIGENGGLDVPANLTVENGDLAVSNLNGSSNAFACLDSSGKLFRSDTACSSATNPGGVFNPSTGSGTWTFPGSTVTSLNIELWGAGGGGAGGVTQNGPGPEQAGGGGAGGGHIQNVIITAAPGQQFSWGVGASGTAGTNDVNGVGTQSNGGNGGQTYFGTFSANGGQGGLVITTQSTGGTYNNGGNGSGQNGSPGQGGFGGGCSPFPCQAPQGGAAGGGSTVYGAGGDGSIQTIQGGGALSGPDFGLKGRIYVTW